MLTDNTDPSSAFIWLAHYIRTLTFQYITLVVILTHKLLFQVSASPVPSLLVEAPAL